MEAQHAGTGRKVVVGIDGSDSALEAVRWAAAEAARRNLPLRVVTALSWDEGRTYGRVGLGADYRDAVREVCRRQLAAAVAVAEEVLGGDDMEQEVVDGFPVPVLQDESRLAQMVVLGDRGYGGVSGLALGSVADAMVSRAECPVVLVRAQEHGPVEDRSRPVVVGVDGSPVSEQALAFAFDAASFRGVPLVAVHAWWDLLLDPKVAPLRDWDAIEADAREVLAERLAGWNAKYPDVHVQRVVTRDRPAHALVEQSRQAQLVVVGSRGRGAGAALLLGSVSHAVLHRGGCSVAVVRPPTEEKR